MDYVSPAYPMTGGTGEKVHRTFLPKEDTYSVECFVGTTANAIDLTSSVPAACSQQIISDPNAPFCKRLDRYILGNPDPSYSDTLPEGENIQYTCTAQPGSPALSNANDAFVIKYMAPNPIAPDIGGPLFNLPPLGYPVFQGKTLGLQYGAHKNNCLVKI